MSAIRRVRRFLVGSIIALFSIIMPAACPGVRAIENTSLIVASQAELKKQAHEIDALILAKQFQQAEYRFRKIMDDDKYRNRIGDRAILPVYMFLFQSSAETYLPAVDEWSKTSPQDSIAHLFLSRLLADYAHEARGSKSIDKVPEAAAHIYQQRHQQALKELELAEKLSPNNLVALYQRLILSRESKRSLEEVHELYRKSEKLAPGSWSFAYQYLESISPQWGGVSEGELFQRARDISRKAPRDSPLVGLIVAAQDIVAPFHGRPREYHQTPGLWEEREQGYREILKRFPRSGFFCAQYARDAFRLGKEELAMGLLKQAQEVEPDNSFVVDLLRDFSDKLSMSPQEERQARDQVIEILERANDLYAKQQYKEAEPLFRKAIEIDPTRHNPWALLGVCLSRQNRFQESIPPLLKSIEISPRTAHYYEELCYSEATLGKYKEAVDHCTQAIGIDSRRKFAYLNRARAYQFLGKQAEAQRDFGIAATLGRD